MLKPDGAERLILQTILDLQGDSGKFIVDKHIAREADMDLNDVRNCLLVLEGKEFISAVRGEGGMRAFVEPKGALALRQSLPFTLKRIEDEQQQQRHELEMIRFILSHLVTRYEVAHLEGLASEAPFPFERRASFDQELRRLRDVGFVENCAGVSPSIARLPPKGGDLKSYFRTTDRGRQYLTFRNEAASE